MSEFIACMLQKSGLITLLGRRVPDLSGYPPVAVAAGICLVASTLTEFMSNSFLTAVAMPILATIVSASNCSCSII